MYLFSEPRCVFQTLGPSEGQQSQLETSKETLSLDLAQEWAKDIDAIFGFNVAHLQKLHQETGGDSKEQKAIRPFPNKLPINLVIENGEQYQIAYRVTIKDDEINTIFFGLFFIING